MNKSHQTNKTIIHIIQTFYVLDLGSLCELSLVLFWQVQQFNV